MITFEKIKEILKNNVIIDKESSFEAKCICCDDESGHLVITRVGKESWKAFCLRCHASNTKLLTFIKNNKATAKVIIKGSDKTPVRKSLTKEAIGYKNIDKFVYRNFNGDVAFVKKKQMMYDIRTGEDIKKVYSFWDETERYVGMPKRLWENEKVHFFNLDLIAKASKSTPIVIVEGEKDCKTLLKYGVLATTTYAGARSKLGINLFEIEKIRSHSSLWCIPDNDEAGAEYLEFMQSMFPDIKVVNLLDYCNVPEKSDISDLLEINEEAFLKIVKEVKAEGGN